MTLKNRVDPWGNLNAVPARGAWMGNRGILHNDQKQIVAPWRHKAWVTCKLEYQGIRRKLFSPGSYSELFFLDEATALAAGHRPCADCRRERYNEFKAAWCGANPELAISSSVSITQIDKQLHAERAIRGGGKVTFETAFENIPEGTLMEVNGSAYLLWNGHLHQWTANGYRPYSLKPLPADPVKVLTPQSIVRMYRQGFRPQVHESCQ